MCSSSAEVTRSASSSTARLAAPTLLIRVFLDQSIDLSLQSNTGLVHVLYTGQFGFGHRLMATYLDLWLVLDSISS
jgi:hypothetical protein